MSRNECSDIKINEIKKKSLMPPNACIPIPSDCSYSRENRAFPNFQK